MSALRTRHRRTVTTLAGLAVVAAAMSPLAAAAVPGRAGSASPTASPPAGLTRVRTLTSLLGTHTWYAQTYRGLPVLDGYYAVHTDRAGRVRVDDGRLPVPDTLATTPAVSAATAVATGRTARAALVTSTASKTAAPRPKAAPLAAAGTGRSTPALSVLAGSPGSAPALVWSVVTTGAGAETRTLVDASTGAVRDTRVLSKNERATPAPTVSGTASVFDPNPVVALGLQTLKDRKDADSPVLAKAYRTVTLSNLLPGGTLSGRWAVVVDAAGGLATSPTGEFIYTRSDDRFEQASAYYGVDRAQVYLRALGFTDVNAEPQDLSVDTIPDDNSFYSPTEDVISYGTGGVDDAEDLEVVWHEYGHAIQDAQVPGFGATAQSSAIGEGFGDYVAVTMSQPRGKGLDTPCVMDWDSTAYTTTEPHCLRRTDTPKTVADLDGEPHDDGEIWSHALWDVNVALGRDRATTVVVEAQFGFSPRTSFAAAARVTVATATTLYGVPVAAQVKAAFVARGIL